MSWPDVCQAEPVAERREHYLVARMRLAGYNDIQIAHKFGVTSATIGNWRMKWGETILKHYQLTTADHLFDGLSPDSGRRLLRIVMQLTDSGSRSPETLLIRLFPWKQKEASQWR
jgi:hypothetical protein